MLIMSDIMHFPALEFFKGPAKELFGGGVHEGHQTLGVHGVKAFAHILHDRVVKFLCFPEGSFGAFDLELAALLFFEEIAHVVLTLARTQSGLNGAPESGSSHGTLKECDGARGGGGEIEESGKTGFAATGQENEGQFRPGGLPLKCFQ